MGGVRIALMRLLLSITQFCNVIRSPFVFDQLHVLLPVDTSRRVTVYNLIPTAVSLL